MLKIEHISKTFNPGTVNEKQAIRDLSLNLEKGDFATIIGSNGAGKSTLFNAICGDFLTDSGVIMLDGQDITFMPQHVRAKTIGRLYQDPMRGTAPGMTIEENLALAAGKGGWLSHVSRQEKERFHEELKLLDIGLEKRMTQPVGLLSFLCASTTLCFLYHSSSNRSFSFVIVPQVHHQFQLHRSLR